MNKFYLLFLFFLLIQVSYTQTVQDKVDSATIAQIREEGLNNSEVMDILSYLTDVYGPRLAGSPGYFAAANWVRDKLKEIGLENAHLESWGPWGKGWTLKKYSANVIGRQNFPLISYPKAWSPGINKTGDIIYFNAKTDSAVNTFRGKLKGKYVLFDETTKIEPPFEPLAERQADSTLLKLANADYRRPRSWRYDRRSPEMMQRALVNYHKMELCEKEDVAGILNISRGDGGNIFVGSASRPMHPDSPWTRSVPIYSEKSPKIIPQIAVSAEHYNRMVRMLEKGEKLKLQVELEVAFNRSDSGYNIIAEIPGTDLRDEVVMVGGHFDSWHGGTGATDNAAGCAASIEAMRIIKKLNLKPRRTIKIALWDAEEHGFLGSRGYIRKHLVKASDSSSSSREEKINYTPEGEKFSVYFNLDNGAGKIRGVYLQGNEAVRPIFRSWLRPFNDLGAATLTILNTGGTDHQAFDQVGLPAFQFIQDELDYSSRTHHSTMDLYERVPEEDLKQAATIIAAFIYNAAMIDEKIPRKQLTPTRSQVPAN